MRREAARPVRARRWPLLSLRRRMSLRSRLLLGLVVVAALGLGVAAFGVYAEIHSYLVGQLQSQMAQAARGDPCDAGSMRAVPADSFVFAVTPQGQDLCLPIYFGYDYGSPVPLKDTPALPVGVLRAVSSSGSAQFSTTSSPVGRSFQLYVYPYQPGAFGPGAVPAAGAVVVIASPFDQINHTSKRLILLDLLVSAAVLALLAAVGYAVVRVGLRPLEAIEETAGRIAAGDLSSRVKRDEPETEVGRLGRSLNAMLGQIEHAFAEQRASEHKMRQFVADAAHELRTPLTSIRGYAELFRRGAASRPEDLERSMRRIEEEANRMGVLVEDLLLLARLDQGRPLERVPVDLVQVAADAAADAQAVDPERPISFESHGPVVVDGDEARLRQVAANLVGNAVVHTPPGTQVAVAVRREGSLAVLEVADTGPGIEPEHAARIFERFYRADSSRTRQSGGTGLGLAIVASLAAAHGGRALVRTAPGAGSTFRVELPAHADAPGEDAPVEHAPVEHAPVEHAPVEPRSGASGLAEPPPVDGEQFGGRSGFAESWIAGAGPGSAPADQPWPTV